MDVQPLLDKIVLPLPVEKRDSLVKALADYLNELLRTDFPSLVQLLYRVDVSEKKLKTVLKDHPEKNAGELIAELLIERQLAKLAVKKNFPFSSPKSDEEKW